MAAFGPPPGQPAPPSKDRQNFVQPMGSTSVDLDNRNRIEGFLILSSTLIWLIATLRALLNGSRFAPLHVGFDGLQDRAPRQEKLWPFIKNVAIFHYFFTRK
jgi:hypothetical protein